VQGQDRIVGLRLAAKGLFRWHTTCCRTPVGNTVTPAIPFVGVVVQAFDDGTQRPDDIFGPPIGAILAQFAIGDVPGASRHMPLTLMLRAIRMVLGWRLRGRAWPNPFFARETRAPVYPVKVLSASEREALRRVCGPQPTAHA
jgi:hypothetical protein